MNSDGFTYHPQAIPDYVQSVATVSGHLEDIRAQAQSVLNGVREYFDSQGADAFIHAQQLINQGIDEGQQIIMRHSTTVDSMHQDMIAQDMSAANSFGM
jgi:uncharacterized protein YukE